MRHLLHGRDNGRKNPDLSFGLSMFPAPFGRKGCKSALLPVCRCIFTPMRLKIMLFEIMLLPVALQCSLLATITSGSTDYRPVFL